MITQRPTTPMPTACRFRYSILSSYDRFEHHLRHLYASYRGTLESRFIKKISQIYSTQPTGVLATRGCRFVVARIVRLANSAMGTTTTWLSNCAKKKTRQALLNITPNYFVMQKVWAWKSRKMDSSAGTW